MVDPVDRRGGRPELGVECVQIGLDVRVVVSIDDGDRLAFARARDATESNASKSICFLELRRRVCPGGRPAAAVKGPHLECRVGQHRRCAEQRARFEVIDLRPQATKCRGAATARSACCSRAH